MARGKAEKQPFQMHLSLRQHLFSVQRYSSNTGQVQNMSTLLEVTVSNHPPMITTPPPSLLLDETGMESVESIPLASSHLPNVSNSIVPNIHRTHHLPSTCPLSQCLTTY